MAGSITSQKGCWREVGLLRNPDGISRTSDKRSHIINDIVKSTENISQVQVPTQSLTAAAVQVTQRSRTWASSSVKVWCFKNQHGRVLLDNGTKHTGQHSTSAIINVDAWCLTRVFIVTSISRLYFVP